MVGFFLYRLVEIINVDNPTTEITTATAFRYRNCVGDSRIMRGHVRHIFRTYFDPLGRRRTRSQCHHL